MLPVDPLLGGLAKMSFGQFKSLGYNTFRALARAPTKRPACGVWASDRWRCPKKWQSNSGRVAVE
jgi:hypothetical protein